MNTAIETLRRMVSMRKSSVKLTSFKNALCQVLLLLFKKKKNPSIQKEQKGRPPFYPGQKLWKS